MVPKPVPSAVDDPDELADWMKDIEEESYVAILLAFWVIAELVPFAVEIWGWKIWGRSGVFSLVDSVLIGVEPFLVWKRQLSSLDQNG